MNLTAKPIVKGEYWVITDGNKKVGNVIAEGSGFQVKIGNVEKHYPTTRAIKTKEHIDFQTLPKVDKKETNPYAMFPTGSSRIYNSMLDVKRKIHLFTKTEKSKCYHAAGWFAIKQGNEFAVSLAPKYIFVQRYECYGPYETEAEANSVINNL